MNKLCYLKSELVGCLVLAVSMRPSPLFAVLGDANFPSASVARAAGTQVIHADGHDIPTLLKAIMQLMPLDKSVTSPVSSRVLHSPAL
jgi:hypothetical protein